MRIYVDLTKAEALLAKLGELLQLARLNDTIDTKDMKIFTKFVDAYNLGTTVTEQLKEALATLEIYQ